MSIYVYMMYSESYGFPVVMYECKSWTIKKAESQRIDAFELWYWRRLLRVPWTTRKSKQSILRKSILNIHWKDWCWSWNSNTLATWGEELTLWKRPWCWERLKTGGEGDEGGWDGWMVSPTEWTGVWVNSGGWWWTGRPGVLQSMRSQRVRHDWEIELKGIFPAKMGTIKDRNGKGLTEAEDIKKRGQEYTEELYENDLYDQITTMVWSLTESQTSWSAKSSGSQEATPLGVFILKVFVTNYVHGKNTQRTVQKRASRPR